MMRAKQFWMVGIGILLAASLLPAQTDAGNGVARVSLMRGEVTVQRGDSGELTEAAINAPLVTGDRMLTGPGSRAELQFDVAHFIRLAPNSEVRMLELRPERYLVAVAEGTVSFSRIDQFDAEVEVNTPSVSLRPVQKGNFRVSVSPDGTSEITVRDGAIEVFSPSGVERLGAGRTMMVRGERDNPEFQFVAQIRKDDFDNWNRDRDRLIQRSESYRYVDRSIPGAYELDAYGSWVNVAPYGMVWRPRVAGGWAPYRHGRWSWVDYWGWSWVSYDSWGWAPFHYGRWFNSPGVGWCWYPGGRTRHYYSPAVVGWFGMGNVSVGIGFGRVGWVPLAPYEPFHRWWGGGWGSYYGGGWRNNRTYIDNSVTIVNNTNITNVYKNSRVNNGYTVMDGQGFARGASVRHNGAGIESLRTASSVRGPVPVTPDRGSLRFGDRSVDRGQMSERLARTDSRQFYTRTTPTRVDRATFDVQRGAMEQVQRQAFGRGASATAGADSGRSSGRGAVAGAGNDAPGRGANGAVATRPAEQGSRTAEAPGRGGSQGGARGAAVAAGENTPQRGGWRRFGEPVTGRGAESVGRGASSQSPTRGGTDAAQGNTGRGDSTQRGASEGSSWRRFGEPASRSDSGRGATAADSTRGADSSRQDSSRGGVVTEGREQRGSQSSRTSSSERGSSANSGSDRGSWQTFGRGGSSSDRSSSGTSGARGTAGDRSTGSRSNRDASVTRESSGSGSSRGASSSQQRLNVSPPIVRERNSGATAAPSSGGRGSGATRSTPNRGTTNRSDLQGSGWRRFEGGAASGVTVQSSSRSQESSATYSSGSRSSTRSTPSVSSDRVFRGSSGSSRSGASTAPSRSTNSGGMRSSGSTPSYGGSSRSTPSMGSGRSSGARSGGMGSIGRSSSGGSMRSGSSGGSMSRGGGGSAGRSGGGSGARSGGRGRN